MKIAIAFVVLAISSASLTLALATGTTAFATSTTGAAATTQTGGAQLTEPDTTFLPKAIREGLAEVEFAKMAAEKGSRPEVKQFAERLVKDHSALNDKLMAIAEERKIDVKGTKGTPPLKPDEEALAKMREMVNLSGAQFDQAFMTQMVEDHEKDIALFKDEAQNGKDEELRKLAAMTLATLEEHFRMAQSIAGQIKASR